MKTRILSAFIVAFSASASAQTVIHCWDFNGTAPGGTFASSPILDDNRVVGNGAITHTFSAAEDFGGDLINACEGSLDGASFAPQHGAVENNNGQSFTLDFPTTCYQDIVFSCWVRRTNTGFTSNTVAYSADAGTTWTDFTTFNPVIASAGELLTVDFSAIPEANNNPLFQVRITLDGSSSTTTGSNMGNNRFDNIKLTGNPIQLGVAANATELAICEGESTVLSGSGALSYVWDNNVVDGATISPSETTTYTVIGTNGAGCEESASVEITVNVPAPVTIVESGSLAFCLGGAVALEVAQGAVYAWSNGSTESSIIATEAADYNVEVTDANGCSVTSNTVTVVVYDLPEVTITPTGTLEFCQGESVLLTATAADFYDWSNGEESQSIVVTDADNYSVLITDANGCSNTSETVTTTVYDLPEALISADGPITFCEGEDVVLSASQGDSYAWSNGSFDPSITVTEGADFTVTVTISNGCSATSEITTVVVNTATPATISASGPTEFCQGENVTLTANANGSYLWSDGSITSSIVVQDASNYSVTFTNGNGCSSTSDDVTVTVYTLPVVSITPDGPTEFCDGQSVLLTATAATSYAWSTGDVSQSITADATDSYSVTTTDANGCSNTSNATDVVVNTTPTPVISASGALQFCIGESVDLAVVPANAFENFLWSNGETTSSITATSGENYSVSMTDASGCVQGTLSAGPVTVSVNGTIPTVQQNGTMLEVTNGPFSEYQWYQNGVLLPNAMGSTYMPTTNDTYTVIVTDASSGCETESETVDFTLIVGVVETGNLGFEAYPNPTEGLITLRLKHQSTMPIILKVVDTMGRIVLEETMNTASSKFVFHLETLETGVYMMQLVAMDGNIASQMVMKR